MAGDPKRSESAASPERYSHGKQSHSASILEVRDVHKTFGGIKAVDGASFDVAERSITALIGPNGAGKTTLFNVLTGFYGGDRGSVTFCGREVLGHAPYRLARMGMVRTFQLTKVLSAMPVVDNVMFAAPEQPAEKLRNLLLRPRRAYRREQEVREQAMEVLATVDLASLSDQYAGTLSGGQRKLLELARALMAKPRLLMLDEPMAGINPSLGERILKHIEKLRETEDMAFLFIEHDIDVVMRYARHVAVMAEGRVIAAAPPDEVRADHRVLEAYLGAPAKAKTDGPQLRSASCGQIDSKDAPGKPRRLPLIEADKVVAGYVAGVNVLGGASLRVDVGDIVTVIGPNGAGKSTLIKTIFGLLQPREGNIEFKAQSIAGMKPHELTHMGLAYVPQLANVFENLTVQENLEVGSLDQLVTEARIEDMCVLFPRLGERRRQRAGTLSGGERQMLAMARALMSKPEALLLDEPSAGLAPAFIDIIFDHVCAINQAGVTILMVEQNAHRALSMSDRGCVLDLGIDRFEGPALELLDNPRVADLYLGERR